MNKDLSRLTQQVMQTKATQGQTGVDRMVTADPTVAALGRFAATLNPADIGQFKTPSLRNVELTAPYMHDGSIPTLQQVIDAEAYVRGAANYPIVLTEAERSDLLAFLQSLTTESFVK